jgi:cob(I)alamin adenosyltransferase
MTIRSGKGDLGFTDLLTQKGVSKDSAQVRAIGDLDEFNAHLGLLKARSRSRADREIIEKIQTSVFVIATEIAVGKEKKKKMGALLTKKDVDWIESLLYEFEQRVKLRSCFHVPGTNEISALFDVARAVARRAERSVAGLFHEEKVRGGEMLSYLNCVSDLLMVMGRRREKKKAAKRRRRKKVSRRGKKA